MTNWLPPSSPFGGEALWGGDELVVRLVLLLVSGPREGENDFLEFPSIEEAITYGRELYAEPRFQLEAIEDSEGRSLISYDHLNELCGPPVAQRRYG